MSEKPFNEPAYPRNYNSDGHNGMYLRDYFAGQALAGLMSSEVKGREYSNEWVAKRSYHVADAMLAAREDGQ